MPSPLFRLECPVGLEIILPAAKEDLLPDVENVAGLLHGNGNIVGDHDDGNAVLVVQIGDQLIHLRRHQRIQTGNRLVQQKDFLRRAQRPGQQHPLLLTAGEIPVAALFKALDAKALHGGAGLFLFRGGVEGRKAPAALETGENDLPHGGGEILLHQGLLGKISHLVVTQSLAKGDGALHGGQKAQNGLHQRGLAGAVFAHHAHIVSCRDGKAQSLEDALSIVAQGEVMTNQL